ncbi:hypothetical protein MRX96_023935 [Rhipicephalus microplus]
MSGGPWEGSPPKHPASNRRSAATKCMFGIFQKRPDDKTVAWDSLECVPCKRGPPEAFNASASLESRTFLPFARATSLHAPASSYNSTLTAFCHVSHVAPPTMRVAESLSFKATVAR